VHVTLDQATCQQTGYCMRIAPDIFAMVDGEVTIVQTDPDAQFDDALDEAERLCPTGAIVIET